MATLRADSIDGHLGPGPFNRRAVFGGVGFIHVLTRGRAGLAPLLRLRHAASDGAGSAEHLRRPPLRAVVEATAHADEAGNRKEAAAAINTQDCPSQPRTAVEQVEEFGHGITPANDHDMRLERQPDQKGGRARTAMGGKFLPYERYWGST